MELTQLTAEDVVEATEATKVCREVLVEMAAVVVEVLLEVAQVLEVLDHKEVTEEACREVPDMQVVVVVVLVLTAQEVMVTVVQARLILYLGLL
jgi:hypothetical protein